MARGISVQTDLCALCETEKETVDHLFTSCKIAEEVKDWIFKWCDIPAKKCQNIEEQFDHAALWGNSPRKKEVINLISYCMLWNIWKARNNKVNHFYGLPPLNVDLVKEINTDPVTGIINDLIKEMNPYPVTGIVLPNPYPITGIVLPLPNPYPIESTRQNHKDRPIKHHVRMGWIDKDITILFATQPSFFLSLEQDITLLRRNEFFYVNYLLCFFTSPTLEEDSPFSNLAPLTSFRIAKDCLVSLFAMSSKFKTKEKNNTGMRLHLAFTSPLTEKLAYFSRLDGQNVILYLEAYLEYKKGIRIFEMYEKALDIKTNVGPNIRA
ncbi:hypothetical protein LXL04_008264 [Taraxacum kok-saghyz]